MLYTSFFNRQTLNLHTQLLEHTLALTATLRITTSKTARSSYLVDNLLRHIGLRGNISNLVMDIKSHIDRVGTIFAEHLVDFEVDCIELVAGAVVSDNILTNYT